MQAYLETHADQFLQTAQLSFTQITFKLDSSASNADSRAVYLLGELGNRSPAELDIHDLGDATLLPLEMVKATSREIANTFGQDFVESIAAAPTGQWDGPFVSGYGLHLVYLTERIAATSPVLTEVREIVERELLNEQRKITNDHFYQALLKHYQVDIQLPQAAASTDRP